jgi:hypothetical protein
VSEFGDKLNTRTTQFALRVIKMTNAKKPIIGSIVKRDETKRLAKGKRRTDSPFCHDHQEQKIGSLILNSVYA